MNSARRFLVLGCAVVLGLGLSGVCAEVTAAEDVEPCIVLRISRALLEDLIPATFTKSFDIDTTVESTRFHGTGQADGRITAQLRQSDTHALLIIDVRGQTTMRFVGSQDPVKFHIRSRGPFEITTQVNFDGQHFSQQDALSSAHQQTNIHRLCSKQRRLLGRIVRSIGWKKVCEARPKINRRVTQQVEEGVANSLDKVVAEVVLELNALIRGELAEMLHQLEPSLKSWRYHLSATPDYLQLVIDLQPKLAAAPTIDLPASLQADIEVWGKLSPQELALLNLASMWHDSHELLKSLLPEQEAKSLPLEAGIRTVGDWAVVEVGRQQ